MKLNELLFEVEIEKLAEILFERTNSQQAEVEDEAGKKEQNNNIVKSWAKKLGMSYDELHAVWDKAVEKAPSKDNYFAIVGIFKKMVTSLDGVTKKSLKDGGNAKFNYKVRTQQTMDQLLDDEPAPKSAKPGDVKKVKEKMSKINAQMREIKAGPANTPLRKQRIKQQLEELKAKKKELQDSIK